jgi:hypothetical protein
MFRGLKLVHFAGLAFVLGSISTFIVISVLIKGASLENIAFGRRIISTGTQVLTIPGIWVLAITGVLMGYKRYGLKQRYFQLKLLFAAIVLINGYLLVIPAVNLATELSARSLAQGQLLQTYRSMYVRESIVGTINIMLIFTAAVIAVWRTGVKPASPQLSPEPAHGAR